MSADEERIAVFLDYENLAIGARENLGGMAFDFKPVADALAERGRVVMRRAYADWLKFGEDGRMLTRHHVELIEIPQRMGSVRKNAADIKMAVDALELCFERPYVTTFVLGTGDSDFTPLVHKLREHNKQVIGLGVQMSTSALLPPACDEFLFYERLEGVEVPKRRATTIVPRGNRRGRRPQVGDVGEVEVEVEAEVELETSAAAENTAPSTIEEVERLIAQTLSGLERTGGAVRASSLKRAILRKESTFSEADYGFRSFTELLRSLAERGVIELADSSSPGDPDVQFPSGGDLGEVGTAFDLLASVVERLAPPPSAGTPLSGLKTQLRRQQAEFSEKRFGFGGFLQFAKAAVTRGMVAMAWNDEADDYLLTPVFGRPVFETASSRGDQPAADVDAAAEVDLAEAPAADWDSAEARSGNGPIISPAPAAEGDGELNGSPRTRRTRGGRGRNGRTARLGETASLAADASSAATDTDAMPSADAEQAPTPAFEVDRAERPQEPVAAIVGPEAVPTAPDALEPAPVEPAAETTSDRTDSAEADTEAPVEAAPAKPRRRTTKKAATDEAATAAPAATSTTRAPRSTAASRAAAKAASASDADAAPAPAARSDAAPGDTGGEEPTVKKPAVRRRRTAKPVAATAAGAAAAGDGSGGIDAPSGA